MPIASTCRAHGAALPTRNLKDTGIVVVDPVARQLLTLSWPGTMPCRRSIEDARHGSAAREVGGSPDD